MENTFQTSFIPKKNIISGAGGKQPPKSILTIIAALLLIVTIGGCIGLYVYKKTLNQKKVTLSASLAQKESFFQKESVDELVLYSNRMKVAQQVLDNHVVLSPLFALLSKLTLREVQFTKFNHYTTPSGFEVKMSGVAPTYQALALQADVFNGTLATSLSGVVFSNIQKNENKKISFELKFRVSPTLLSYVKSEMTNDTQQDAPVTPALVEPVIPSKPETTPPNNAIIKP